MLDLEVRGAVAVRRWLPIALAVAAGLALFASSAGASGRPLVSKDAEGIRVLVRPAAEAMGMPGLADFLAAKAYTESHFNPKAGNCTNNGACGLYGTREQSAGVPGVLLHDPSWATLGAVDLAWRLGHKSYHSPGQVITWGALARGWALPSLVADVDWEIERSQDALERFEQALAAVGLPSSFIDEPAYPPGAHHPGLAALKAALGLFGGVA